MIGIDLVEEYILTANKEEFFKKLIKGSAEHRALTLLHAMNNKGL